MPFQFKRREKTDSGVRRMAHEQITRILSEIEAAPEGQHVAIHNVRKRCKKLRSLIRLVRSEFAGKKSYARENASIRDAARLLSGLRDAQSIIEAYDALIDRDDLPSKSEGLDQVRQLLIARRDEATDEQSSLADRVEQFQQAMRAALKRAGRWKFGSSNFRLLQQGLEQTYSNGLAAMQHANHKPTTENFHEWRKHVKYHWHHLEMVKSIWDEPLAARIGAAKTLSEYLGDDHDLAVLTEVIKEPAFETIDPETRKLLTKLIESRRAELQSQAAALGKRMYAEQPSAFTKRMKAYWKAWRKDVPPSETKKKRPRLKLAAGS